MKNQILGGMAVQAFITDFVQATDIVKVSAIQQVFTGIILLITMWVLDNRR